MRTPSGTRSDSLKWPRIPSWVPAVRTRRGRLLPLRRPLLVRKNLLLLNRSTIFERRARRSRSRTTTKSSSLPIRVRPRHSSPAGPSTLGTPSSRSGKSKSTPLRACLRRSRREVKRRANWNRCGGKRCARSITGARSGSCARGRGSIGSGWNCFGFGLASMMLRPRGRIASRWREEMVVGMGKRQPRRRWWSRRMGPKGRTRQRRRKGRRRSWRRRGSLRARRGVRCGTRRREKGPRRTWTTCGTWSSTG